MQQIIQECASLSEWREIEVPSSEEGKTYLVTIPPWEATEVEVVCECRSYEYRGRCRHQREAMKYLCHWSSLEGDRATPEQVRKQICPECGGPTNTVLIEED